MTLSQDASATASVELLVDEQLPLLLQFEKTEVVCSAQLTPLQSANAFAAVISELQVDVEGPWELL